MSTLHDFTLSLLSDLDAREAFQLDPQGVLESAGLGDITPGEIQEILPLVLDTASVAKVDALDDVLANAGDIAAADQLKLVTGNLDGLTSITDVANLGAPSAVTALVTDFGNVGDVAGTLDVVSDVTTVVQDNSVVSTVTHVADVQDVVNTDVLVKDLDTDVLVKDVANTDVLLKDTDMLVKDVANLDLDVENVVDVSDNVVQDVAQVGDVHNSVGQVVGDLNVGDLDLLDGGLGNGNDLNIHF
ncbi:IniB N-terminal domain-containing protein [Lentzea sp. NPDC042327]|uniref:IniB N-terminal domain-containing protein n=1 Tax=Lentzea sp. NPDC042327 TaxID=3154801 RepID=UPI0033FC25FD